MPAHPTRRTYRANETRRWSGYRPPIAFIGSPDDSVALTENPNRGRRHSPRLVDCSDTESLARAFGVAPMTFAAAMSDGITRDGTLTVTTPARDSRGRRNPRMRPSSYSV